MQTKSIFSNLYTSSHFSNLPDFKEKKTQAFITLALTLVALSFFGIFAITPTVSTIANLQKQKEDNTFVEQKLDEKTANLGVLSKKYADLTDDLEYVFRALPKSPEIPTLTGKIYTLGKKSNITISRIQSQEVELTKTTDGPQQYSSFIISIDAIGTYENLNAFLQSLTTFDRVITLDTISIATTQEGSLKMTIQGKGYFKL